MRLHRGIPQPAGRPQAAGRHRRDGGGVSRRHDLHGGLRHPHHGHLPARHPLPAAPFNPSDLRPRLPCLRHPRRLRRPSRGPLPPPRNHHRHLRRHGPRPRLLQQPAAGEGAWGGGADRLLPSRRRRPGRKTPPKGRGLSRRRLRDDHPDHRRVDPRGAAAGPDATSSVLAAHKTIPGPMAILAADPELQVDGYLCPAHVIGDHRRRRLPAPGPGPPRPLRRHRLRAPRHAAGGGDARPPGAEPGRRGWRTSTAASSSSRAIRKAQADPGARSSNPATPAGGASASSPAAA